MTPEYELSIREEEINMISNISGETITDIWVIRPRAYGKNRFDRHGFVQAEAILMQGASDVYFLPDPRAMPSGYDEILIGVAHEDPNGGMPRALFARFGSNEDSVSEIKTLKSEQYISSIVRERTPVIKGNDPNASPEYFNIYDVGVLFRGRNDGNILVMAHISETWTVEISSDNESINREIANYTLIPL